MGMRRHIKSVFSRRRKLRWRHVRDVLGVIGSPFVMVLLLILSYPFLVTVIHELGHAIAATLLGYEVKHISFGFGDLAYVYIQGPFDAIHYDLIQLAGGLMVGLFFIVLALSHRPFLLLAPPHIIYGIYEMLGPIPDYIGTQMALSWVVFMAVLLNRAIKRKRRHHG